MDATLHGTTTRPVTFTQGGRTHTAPAGTAVYATPRRGVLRIRIPGTLWTQDVYASAVRPA